MSSQQTIYITYDLEQTGRVRDLVVYRGAKEVRVSGEVISWEVGEFKLHEVEDTTGVKIRYRSVPNDEPKEEIVPVSGYARNVRVFLGEIPAEYRAGLQNAA